MGNKLYVGNLPYSVRDSDLEQAFSQFGSVTSAKVMMERDTGRSKGFGFVEMGSDAEAQAAITGMNGQSLGGRSVVVNEARPMESRPPRSGGYGGGGGGGGGVWRRWRRWRWRRWPARRRQRWWRLRRAWRQRWRIPQPLRFGPARRRQSRRLLKSQKAHQHAEAPKGASFRFSPRLAAVCVASRRTPGRRPNSAAAATAWPRRPSARE